MYDFGQPFSFPVPRASLPVKRLHLWNFLKNEWSPSVTGLLFVRFKANELNVDDEYEHDAGIEVGVLFCLCNAVSCVCTSNEETKARFHFYVWNELIPKII